MNRKGTLTFFFFLRLTLTPSTDTTMLTFFFLMFFTLNSYCEKTKKQKTDRVKLIHSDSTVTVALRELLQYLLAVSSFLYQVFRISHCSAGTPCREFLQEYQRHQRSIRSEKLELLGQLYDYSSTGCHVCIGVRRQMETHDFLSSKSAELFVNPWWLGCWELPLCFHQKLAWDQAHFTAGTQRDTALETIIPL